MWTVAFGWAKIRAVFSLITGSGRRNVKAMKNLDWLQTEASVIC
jgi:hypothetical protein